jgi:hypothetical protein
LKKQLLSSPSKFGSTYGVKVSIGEGLVGPATCTECCVIGKDRNTVERSDHRKFYGP